MVLGEKIMSTSLFTYVDVTLYICIPAVTVFPLNGASMAILGWNEAFPTVYLTDGAGFRGKAA